MNVSEKYIEKEFEKQKEKIKDLLKDNFLGKLKTS